MQKCKVETCLFCISAAMARYRPRTNISAFPLPEGVIDASICQYLWF
jgi:hypothetical protein